MKLVKSSKNYKTSLAYFENYEINQKAHKIGKISLTPIILKKATFIEIIEKVELQKSEK